MKKGGKSNLIVEKSDKLYYSQMNKAKINSDQPTL
jgi:hypothetical protein